MHCRGEARRRGIRLERQGVRKQKMATGRLRRRKSTSQPSGWLRGRGASMALWLRLSAAHSRKHSLESPARHQNRVKYAREDVQTPLLQRDNTDICIHQKSHYFSDKTNRHQSLETLRDFYCKSQFTNPEEKFFAQKLLFAISDAFKFLRRIPCFRINLIRNTYSYWKNELLNLD